MRILILLGCILLPGYAQSQPSWETILFYENGRSAVTSQEFFTTETGRFDSHKELNNSLELIESSSKHAFACEFPFRYEWLRKKYRNIPVYDFTQCDALSSFKKDLQGNSLKIGFASEQIDTPASAFGHIFIIFENRDKTVHLSPTIQFLAEVDEKSNSFAYAYNGLIGGFDGYYQKIPFYKLAFSYNQIQQRDIYTTEITNNPEKIDLLIYLLFEMRKVKIPYFFTAGNCSSRLADLLIMAELYPSKTNTLFPSDVFTYYFNRSGQVNQIASTFTKATLIRKNFSNADLDEWNLYQRKIKNVTDLSSDLTKELATLQSQYNFRRNQSPPENYSEIAELHYKKSNFNSPQKNPTTYEFMQLKVTQQFGDASNFQIGIRPGFKNLWEEENGSHLSSLIIGETTLSLQEKGHISLHKLDLLSVTTINPINSFSKKPSWKLDIGHRPDLNDQNSKINTEIGLGTGVVFKKFMVAGFVDLGGRLNEPIYFGTTGSIKYDLTNNQSFIAEHKYRMQERMNTKQLSFQYQYKVGKNLFGMKFLDSTKKDYLGLSYSLHFR